MTARAGTIGAMWLAAGIVANCAWTRDARAQDLLLQNSGQALVIGIDLVQRPGRSLPKIGEVLVHSRRELAVTVSGRSWVSNA